MSKLQKTIPPKNNEFVEDEQNNDNNVFVAVSPKDRLQLRLYCKCDCLKINTPQNTKKCDFCQGVANGDVKMTNYYGEDTGLIPKNSEQIFIKKNLLKKIEVNRFLE